MGRCCVGLQQGTGLIASGAVRDSEVNVEVQHAASRFMTFLRGAKVQAFARTLIEFIRDPCAVRLGEVFHADGFRQIVSDSSVGVFIRPALPRVVRCGEIAARRRYEEMRGIA